MREKYYIIGGGPLGMSLALHGALNKKIPYLIESGKELGGLAAPLKHNNYLIDKYYHFYYKGDELGSKNFFNLLNLDFKIFWKSISTSSYFNKQFHNFDNILSIVSICKTEIIKVIFTLIKIRLFNPSIKLDQISAYTWCKKKFGYNLTKFVWKPLLSSKFGGDWNNISAFWLCTRIKIHLGTKSFFSGKSRFAYLTTTYKIGIDKLILKIKNCKGNIFLNEKVISFIIQDNLILYIITNKRKIKITSDDKVISTVPLASLKNITPLKKRLKYLKHFDCVGAVVVIFEINSKLSNDYWTTVSDKSIKFDVVIQQNRLYPNTKKEIVYVSKYFSSNDNFAKSNKKLILKIFLDGLKKMYPNFSKKDLITMKLFKTYYAAPTPKKNYGTLLPDFKTNISNFYHVGFEHTYPQDRGVSNSFNLGKKIFDYIN